MANGAKKVVDTHRHFVEAGGFSEHMLFVLDLIDKQSGYGTEIPKGPKNNRPVAKKHAKAKAKRSEVLKRMLKPPKPAGQGDVVFASVEEGGLMADEDVELPPLPSHASWMLALTAGAAPPESKSPSAGFCMAT